MEKVITFILLLHLSLVKLEAQINKNQDVPLQLNQASCPEDDEFEYDAFEIMVKNLSIETGINILPRYSDVVDLCKNDPDSEECLRKFFSLIPPDFEPANNRQILNNGIEVLSLEVADPQPNVTNSDLIAKTLDRTNDEDLHCYCSEDNYFVKPITLRNELDPDLKNRMKYFMIAFTIKPTLRGVRDAYINSFYDNLSCSISENFNNALSTYFKDHIECQNFIKKFGEVLNDNLKNVNGDINLITSPINLLDIGPKFEDFYDKYDGTSVLIGNTEQSFVYKLGNYIYDPISKRWEGDFYFKITDNFGLDKMDVTEKYDTDNKYFNLVPGIILDGLTAWWLLSHSRGHTPFITSLRIKARISGTIN